MTTEAPAGATVADLVVADARTARVFERFGIDYCCGGDRPLNDACDCADLDPAAVRAALDEVLSGSRQGSGLFNAPADIGGLIGHIVATYHLWLRAELPRFENLFSKVLDAHGAAHLDLHRAAVTFRELVDDLVPHLTKEERVLFPLAIELLGAVTKPEFRCGSVQNPISVIRLEHDRVGTLLARLREQTNGYQPPPDACPTWRTLWAGLAELESQTHEHIHLEDNLLFPRLVALEAAFG